MNNKRRKELQKCFDRLEELVVDLTEIRDEQQEAFENMPETFHDSSKGLLMSDELETLDEMMSSLEDAKDLLETLF